MELITVVVTQLENGDVDSRAYDANGAAIIGKDGAGEDYHLGQISSSLEWAKQDMRNHFAERYDAMFPNGWDLKFEYRET